MLRLLSDKKLGLKLFRCFVVFFLSFFFLNFLFSFSSFAATYYWNQSDWSGGSDTSSFAKHDTNQSAWTKYFSKDDSLTTNSGSVSLSPTQESLSHNSSVGFTSSTLTNIEFSNDNLQLKMADGNQQVSAGYYNTCALKNDGTVWCWGYNSSGQLGIGTTSVSMVYTPVQVVGIGGTGTLTNISQISVGLGMSSYGHTCALKNDGTVWCWGYNKYGQLGIGTTATKTSPVQTLGPGGTGVFTNVSQIATGSQSVCALKTDSTVWCWGINDSGQLGNNSNYGKRFPTQVVGAGGTGVLTDVSKISMGSYTTCAVKTDNTVWCWGSGNSGQLGNNSSSSSYFPVQVLSSDGVTYLSDVSYISVGGSHTCAVKTDGTAWCWGYGHYGQLGIGTTTTQYLPVQVLDSDGSGTLNNVSQISLGYSFSCALKTDGTMWCWGYNDDGQAGLGYRTYSVGITLPLQSGGSSFTNVSQISAGQSHVCALKSDGTAWCWGDNYYGKLGVNSLDDDKYSPTQVYNTLGSGIFSDVSKFSAGSAHTCAVKSDGTVWCWGGNSSGQLGINSTVSKSIPTQVLDPGGTGVLTNVSQVSAGNSHTCAVKTDGTVWCWGYGGAGRLGNNSTSDKRTPVQVVGVGGSGFLTNVSQISAGQSHVCALKSDGTAWCWGDNSNGRLGNNSSVYPQSTPIQVADVNMNPITNFSQISAGYRHTCAFKTDGTAWCWGYNNYGQLGIGSTANSSLPTQVLGSGGTGVLTNISQISTGESHSCVLKTDGTAWCWGSNYYGQIGSMNRYGGDKNIPIQVFGPSGTINPGYLTDISQISAGSSYTCAVKTDGTAWCWGYNRNSQLGNNTSVDYSTTVPVLDPVGGWELRLAGFYSSGNLLSPVINLGKNVNLNSLSLSKSLPSSGTTIKVQIKTSDTEAGLSSALWSGPDGTSSTYFTSDSSSLDSFSLKPFVQYQAILETSSPSKTPTLSSLGLNYQSYSPSGVLISSPYDSQTDENLISNISWMKSTPDNTSVQYQLRSASSQAGLISSSWLGPDGTSSTYFTSNLGETTPSSLRDGLSDRWLQYKVLLSTDDTSVTPTLYDNTVTYVVNAPPSFDTSYQTDGFGITRSETPGIFNFLYKIGDTDTADASVGNQYRLWPTFQYTLDNGGTWTTITTDQLSGYTTDNPIILTDGSTYVEGATVWDATTALANTYGTIKIRIIVDDHEAANNTSTITSDSFIFDTKLPTIGTVDGGGSGININHNQTTSLAIDKTNNPNVTLYFSATDDSDLKIRYGLTSSLSAIDYQDYASSVGFTLPSTTDGSKRVYVQFKDAYGNESDVYSDVIQLDTTAPTDDSDLFLQDISNPNTSEARLFLNWAKNTDSDWQGYRIYVSEEGSDFSLVQSIDNVNSNYILQDNLTNTHSYTYKVTNIDDLNNESIGSTITQTVWGNPTDLVPPTITNIQVSHKTTSSVTILWTTDEVANDSILYSTDDSYSESEVGTGYSRQHSLILSGLSAGTQYNFKIRVTDPSGNSTDSDASTFTTNTPDTTPPVITNINTSNLSSSRVDISFTTDELASSFIEYSTTSGFTNGTVFGQNDFSLSHSVSLRSLSPSTPYYYKIHSVDASGNQATSSEQTFTTSATSTDTTSPSISNVSVGSIQYNTATITFTTDENASSFVEFGKDTTYGRLYGQDNNVTGHSVTLPYDLSPETIYYYRIRTKDLSGNETLGVGSSFTTSANPHDSTAPTISNVTISEPQQNSVTITWVTNEPSTSYIDYGQDTNYSLQQGNSSMVQNHSLTLVGLNPQTVYLFRIKSVDPSGNISSDNNSNQGYQFATSSGDNPPTIYSNQIKDVTTSSANIYWETNINSNSYVEYGLDTTYGNLIGSNSLTDQHTISLSGLLSGATYYFRVKSATSTNAESVSSNFTITTQGIASTTPVEPVNNDPSEETILDKIKNGTSDLIKKVLDLIPGSSLSEEDFIDKMNTLSPKIVSSPSISSSNITVDPGVDKIVISWTTDKKSNSVVVYTPDSDFDSANPVYSSEVGKYDESVTSHSVELTNLNPNTTYHYKVRSKSDYGNWTDSEDFTFATLSINSEIKDFRFTKVTQKSVSASWSTTFDSRAMFEVTDILSGKSVVKSEEQGFSRDHSFTTDQLQTSTNYQLQISTVAKDGTVSEASLFPFSTSTSSEPPLISNVRISNALISGAVEQVQTIISWKTDKPSTSRILYNEGTSKELSQSTSLDKSLVTDHVVVTTNLKPGKVYKFKVESVDSNDSPSLSKDYLIMTPKTQESVINLIIDNFMESFSFVTKGRQ